jgi:hypothetical protein
VAFGALATLPKISVATTGSSLQAVCPASKVQQDRHREWVAARSWSGFAITISLDFRKLVTDAPWGDPSTFWTFSAPAKAAQSITGDVENLSRTLFVYKPIENGLFISHSCQFLRPLT